MTKLDKLTAMEVTMLLRILNFGDAEPRIKRANDVLAVLASEEFSIIEQDFRGFTGLIRTRIVWVKPESGDISNGVFYYKSGHKWEYGMLPTNPGQRYTVNPKSRFVA